MAVFGRRKLKSRALSPTCLAVLAFVFVAATSWSWRPWWVGTPGLHTQYRELDDDDQLGRADFQELCDRSRYPQVWELRGDQITVLINGFSEERLSLLQTNVRFFSSLTIVHSIFILWGNTSTPNSVLDETDFVSVGAPIYVVRQQSQSLNDRFLPRPYIITRAVMICDDDITVDGDSLEFSFRTWISNQKQIVGFFPRAHSYQLDSKSWIYSKLPNQYSILLTKLMILATEYLFLYTCMMPDGVKEYVDRGMNCEDLAMNFVVSNYSGLGPLLVEGKPRDWGDTRNSAGELSTIGLSARAGHRKDRGDCITVFQKLWGGMKLRFSYGKVSPYKEEQALCDKYGYLINCDEPVASKRHAQRLAGQNVVTLTEKYAYVTFISRRKHLNSAVTLAQSLVNSGTVHDLVLLLLPSSGFRARDNILQQHFDVVKKVKKKSIPEGFAAVNAWLLTGYSKVILINTHSLVLKNLDHLFRLPEPVAAPHVSIAGHFDTGLLVLKPSTSTFAELVALVDELPSSCRSTHHLLNAYFTGWFWMSPEHRLPVHYNPPILFSPQVIALSDMYGDVNVTYQRLSPPAMVRTARPGFTSKLENIQDIDVCASLSFCQAWLQLFRELKRNDFTPLHFLPQPERYGGRIVNATGEERWLSNPQLRTKRWFALPSVEVDSGNATRAFATAIWDSSQGVLIESWVASFVRHHRTPWLACKIMLLVLSTVGSSVWGPYVELFDTVVVVEPVVDFQSISSQRSLMLLHMWNQKSFNKLVYAEAGSIFMENCFSLFDYSSPFAAVPNSFPTDTFSSRLMLVEPNEQTFKALVVELQNYHGMRYDGLVIDHILNMYYFDWYQQQERHRIAPVFSKDLKAVISGLVTNEVAGTWKIWSFAGSKCGSRWQSNPTNLRKLSKMRENVLCSPELSLRNVSLCRSVTKQDAGAISTIF